MQMVFCIPINVSEIFKVPDIALSATFLFKFCLFLVTLLFASSVITALGSCRIKQLPLIVFHKCSQGGGCRRPVWALS